LRGSLHFGMIALLLGSALQSPAQEQPKKTPVQKASNGTKLAPTRQGDSVRFYLPESWVAKSWKGDRGVKPYVAQLPPHKLDIEEDFAPCLPPPRIAIGYVDAAKVVHEKLAACINFCDSLPSDKLFYAGLWGRLTRVERVDVFLKDDLKDDGQLDVKFLLKELGGSEIRTRHLPLKGPRESLPAEEAGSCTAE
jgi:hypothetical protein